MVRRVEEGYVDVDMEMDSLILLQILQRKVEVPWSIVYEVRAMMRCLEVLNCQLSHTYRESNRPADILANIGCSVQKKVEYNSFGELPLAVWGSVNTDRSGIPNLHYKK